MKKPAVTIEYCGVCNYLSRAAALSAAIEKEFGVKPKLIEGSAGVFDVKVEGKLIYSKKATWRFPENDEIFFHVQQAAQAC
jgi:selenoprotein W-related protein